MGKYTGAEPGNSTGSLPGTEWGQGWAEVDRLTQTYTQASHWRVLWLGQHQQHTHAPLALTKVTWWMGWMGSHGLPQCRPPQRQVREEQHQLLFSVPINQALMNVFWALRFVCPVTCCDFCDPWKWDLRLGPATSLGLISLLPKGTQCSLTGPEARKQLPWGW